MKVLLASRGALSMMVLAASLVVLTASPIVRPALLMVQEPSQPAADFKEKCVARLAEIARSIDGVVGYEILDLTSGDRFAHLENGVFPTASSIKLAIVYELFKQVEEGRIRLDESLVLDRSKAVGGSGVLVHLGTPTLTIRDYAALMVTLSDNTATNVLIDRLGMDAINARIQTLGLKSTKLRRHMMDTAAARRGDENVSSPDDFVRLLQAMAGAHGSDNDHGRMVATVELLKLPKESRLRRGIPDGVQVADKPGELDGVRADAGIVFVGNRPYAFVVMTTFLKDESEGERAIEEMSRSAYQYFSRLGASGPEGRRFPGVR
jgi:beta-lactamase class A